ncbi:MAG TPA: hypothetical protein DCQ34_05775 [Chitinophagaceae bacterium]|nr:hypothetical protein [Chitinophagaceae bacterium]
MYFHSMGAEQNPRAYLVLVANSIAIVLIWMIINVFFGIYLGWGFFENSPGWKNWLYYALALGTLFLIGKFLYKKWKDYL